MKFAISCGWGYGFLFRISLKNYIRIIWHSFGELTKPRFSVMVFNNKIIDTI